MTASDPLALTPAALSEIGAAIAAISRPDLAALIDHLAGAGKIMVYGCGREGLMMRAFAMRLHHLGLSVSVQGDMAAPPLGVGDLFLAACGPGHLATVSALAGVARSVGASVAVITAEPKGDSIARTDLVLTIPAQTMARADTGTLPMGSLFEGALFILGEALVQALTERLGETPASMAERHTNME